MAMLTYSDLPIGALKKEGIVAFIKDRATESMAKELIEWSCGREPHEDPTKEHFHVYVKFKERPNWKWGNGTPCALNIPYAGGQSAVCRVDQHDANGGDERDNERGADVQKKRSAKDSRMTMIRYTMKGEQSHDEFVAQHEKGPNFGKNADVYQSEGLLVAQHEKGPNFGKNADVYQSEGLLEEAGAGRMTGFDLGCAMRDAESKEAAMDLLWEHNPIEAMKFGHNYKKNLEERMEGHEKSNYDLSLFEAPPLDLTGKGLRCKSYIYPGESARMLIDRTQAANH
jgi:hypothetical protein